MGSAVTMVTAVVSMATALVLESTKDLRRNQQKKEKKPPKISEATQNSKSEETRVSDASPMESATGTIRTLETNRRACDDSKTVTFTRLASYDFMRNHNMVTGSSSDDRSDNFCLEIPMCDGTNFEQFILKFEAVADSLQWSSEIKLLQLECALVGKARDILSKDPCKIWSYSDLKTALEIQFVTFKLAESFPRGTVLVNKRVDKSLQDDSNRMMAASNSNWKLSRTHTKA